mmetsp:Transcript_9956/g.28281  ORF Transcript_9956/g.28281 Transcript_9956/m.28281 type:complete len:510 (-) Transcript_9956:537-2066(-)
MISRPWRLLGPTLRQPRLSRSRGRPLSSKHEGSSYIMPKGEARPSRARSVPFETDLSKASLPAVDLEGAAEAAAYIMPKPVPMPSALQLRRHVLAAAIPMVGFGFMDNLIMIQAGDIIDNTFCVAFGFSTLTAAALGQIVSDVSGVTFGGVVDALCTRLGLPSAELTLQQEQLKFVRFLATAGAALGVVLGCLLGMTSLFTLDLQKAERAKLQSELQTLFNTIMKESAEISSTMHCSLWILEADGKHLWSRVHQGEVLSEVELMAAWSAISGSSRVRGDSLGPGAPPHLDEYRVEDPRLGSERVHVDALAKPLLELGYHISESEMESLLQRVSCRDGHLDFAQYSELMMEIVWREERHLPVESSPILRTVVREKRTVNIVDAHKSDQFNPDLERYSGYKLVSVLAAPIIGKEGEVLGVIELMNKMQQSRPPSLSSSSAPRASSSPSSLSSLSSSSSSSSATPSPVPLHEGQRSAAKGPSPKIIPFSYDDERVLRLQCAHAAAFIQQCSS